MDALIDIGVPIGTLCATGVLACFTIVLARATNQLAQRSSQPLVTATIQFNIWSMKHCDFVVENSGNAPAFDVVVKITPEPDLAEERGKLGPPLRDISILRPNQTMKSFLTDAERVLDTEFKLEVSWKRNPGDRTTESIAYRHRLPKEVSRAGPWSPEMQLAEELKRLREDWEPVASGMTQATKAGEPLHRPKPS